MSVDTLPIKEFSGGITDDVVGSRPNQFVTGDNLFLNDSAKLFTRFGSELFDDTHAQLPSGSQRVGALINFKENTALLAQSARQMFYYDASGWNEILGPELNPALSAGTTAARVSYDQWKGHVYILNDAASSFMKIYQDEDGAYQVRNAGLPMFIQQPAVWDITTAPLDLVDLANDINLAMNTHFNSVGGAFPGHSIYTPANTYSGVLTPTPDNTAYALLPLTPLALDDDLATVIAFTKSLISAYQSHYGDAIKPKELRQFHMNLETSPGVPNIPLIYNADPKNFFEVARVLNEIKRNFNWHVRSFKGHFDDSFELPQGVEVPIQHVVAAELGDTEKGPVFGDLDYTNAIDFANTIKEHFNAHLNDTIYSHPTARAFNFETDFENQVYLPDATDLDSLTELTAHLYQAYFNHHGDLTTPIFGFRGLVHNPAVPKIDTITNWQVVIGTEQPGLFGQLANIEVGFFVRADELASAAGVAFPANTRVTALDIPTATVTTNNANSGGFGADNTIKFCVSKMRYHQLAYVNPFEDLDKDPAFPDIHSGDLKVVDINNLITDLGVIASTLLDVSTKFNLHDFDFAPHSTSKVRFGHSASGSHKISSDNVPQNFTVFSYEYGFVYSYKYTTLDGTDFENRSKPLYKTKKSLYPIGSIASSITNLPVILNGATENYDVSNIKLEIYRSVDAGSVLFLAGTVTNGEAGFVDSFLDIEIISNQTIYTNGGVLDNDPPPTAKFFHIVDDFQGYMGAPTVTNADGTVNVLPNRIQQAVSGDMDSWPGGSYVDLPGAVTGLTSARNIPITFSANATFRIEGVFDLLGRGQMRAVPISTTIGCVAGSSPVQVDNGVLFWADDGVYFTDGYRVTKLSNEWNTTYRGMTSTSQRRLNVTGTLDSKLNRVFWGVTDSGSENNKWIALELNYGMDPQHGACFLTGSGGANFAPTSLCYFNGELIRGDSRGYVFKHNTSLLADPKVDIAVDPTLWTTAPITWTYRSTASDFGSNERTKWTTRIFTRFGAATAASVQITGITDLGKNTGNCTPIRYRGTSQIIDEKRHFPRGNLRCNYKQIEMTNASVVILNSDDLGEATVDHAAKTVTLLAGSFTGDQVDQVITFENDDYTQEFTISTQSGGALLVVDAGGLLPVNGNYAWEIKGPPKDERVTILEYGTQFSLFGPNETDASGESGANS